MAKKRNKDEDVFVTRQAGAVGPGATVEGDVTNETAPPPATPDLEPREVAAAILAAAGAPPAALDQEAPAVRFEGSTDDGRTWAPVEAGEWPVGMIVRRVG